MQIWQTKIFDYYRQIWNPAGADDYPIQKWICDIEELNWFTHFFYAIDGEPDCENMEYP